MLNEMKENLFRELDKLHKRNVLSQSVEAGYFEPGMMEYLEQSEGRYDVSTGEILIRFESKGTRYDGRTEQIEKVKVGDAILVVREKGNLFNANNFVLQTKRGVDVGNMPIELCNVIAPLYDEGHFSVVDASVSFVEPISKRSRYAKQAILFVELRGVMHDI